MKNLIHRIKIRLRAFQVLILMRLYPDVREKVRAYREGINSITLKQLEKEGLIKKVFNEKTRQWDYLDTGKSKDMTDQEKLEIIFEGWKKAIIK